MNALGTKKSQAVKAKVVPEEPEQEVSTSQEEDEEKAKAAFPEFWNSLTVSEKLRFIELKKTLCS